MGVGGIYVAVMLSRMCAIQLDGGGSDPDSHSTPFED